MVSVQVTHAGRGNPPHLPKEADAMITDWVVYRDGLPDFPTRSDARTANALLTLLQLADPAHVWDVYPQKWGEWFDD